MKGKRRNSFTFIIPIFMLIFVVTKTDPVINTILANYVKGEIPSTTTLPLNIDHQISISPFSKIEEVQMNFEIIIKERMSWKFNDLAFENIASINSKYKIEYINLKSVIADIWIPRTHVTSLVKEELKQESLLLYPDGTLEYTAVKFLILT